jgi:hypothetical protein
MKSAELQVGVRYGVIPSWDYSSADKKDPTKVQRRNVANSALVSLEKYEYKVYRSDNPDDAQFTPAPKGSRSVGYLVRSSDWAGNGSTGDIYWLARAQDIVAEYATLETRWVPKRQKRRLVRLNGRQSVKPKSNKSDSKERRLSALLMRSKNLFDH